MQTLSLRPSQSLLLGSLLLAALSPSTLAQNPAPDVSDQYYGLGTMPPGLALDQMQVLDFYKASQAGPRPVVVWLHAGGFFSGDEQINVDAPLYAGWLARGWSIASVRYRLSAETCAESMTGTYVSYPDHIQDVSLAVQYLRMHAGPADLNIDCDRIVLYGRSAGGHMATWLAMAEDHAAFSVGSQPGGGYGHGSQYPTRVRAARNGGGPTDWLYPAPAASSTSNAYFDWFDAAGCSNLPFIEAVGKVDLQFASTVWHAPQYLANQNVGLWHFFSGPVGGNEHDPHYGKELHAQVQTLGSQVSYLDWDQAATSPTITEDEWLDIMNVSVPYGKAFSGADIKPSLSLQALGALDTFLVSGVRPNTSVKLLLGAFPANAPAAGGSIYVDPASAVTLYATSNATGTAEFNLDMSLPKGAFNLYAQAGWQDAESPGGWALTQGLKLCYEDL